MEKEKMGESSKPITDFLDRRDFCKKAIKRSSVAAAVGVVGYIAYKKPEIRRCGKLENASSADPVRVLSGVYRNGVPK